MTSVVDATEKVDQTTRAVEAAITVPAKKAAAFGAGVSQAVSSFFSRGADSGEDGRADDGAPAAGAWRPASAPWTPRAQRRAAAADAEAATAPPHRHRRRRRHVPPPPRPTPVTDAPRPRAGARRSDRRRERRMRLRGTLIFGTALAGAGARLLRARPQAGHGAELRRRAAPAPRRRPARLRRSPAPGTARHRRRSARRPRSARARSTSALTAAAPRDSGRPAEGRRSRGRHDPSSSLGDARGLLRRAHGARRRGGARRPVARRDRRPLRGRRRAAHGRDRLRRSASPRAGHRGGRRRREHQRRAVPLRGPARPVERHAATAGSTSRRSCAASVESVEVCAAPDDCYCVVFVKRRGAS